MTSYPRVHEDARYLVAPAEILAGGGIAGWWGPGIVHGRCRRPVTPGPGSAPLTTLACHPNARALMPGAVRDRRDLSL